MSSDLSFSLDRRSTPSGIPLLIGMMVLIVLAALLSGWIPIQFSIATVFLFAGPHNWFEARYILARLPARAGKLWNYFALSFVGIVGLATSFALLPTLLEWLPDLDSHTAYATWNTLFLLWIATLVHMRSQTNPKRDWFWFWPLTFALISVNWLEPFWFSMALVYLHPLLALWILDRELKRTKPQWRRAYHCCLLSLPIFITILVIRLHNAPYLDSDDALSLAIIRHSGDWVFPEIPNHLLVALHTFLEMVHYAIWVIAIPLIGYRSMPWDLQTIPAARRNATWKRGIALFLLTGLLIVLVLWVCFLIDYSTTRHIYFVVALVHVLAEVPFLLRIL
jgi:hypothetical protein